MHASAERSGADRSGADRSGVGGVAWSPQPTAASAATVTYRIAQNIPGIRIIGRKTPRHTLHYLDIARPGHDRDFRPYIDCPNRLDTLRLVRSRALQNTRRA